MARIFLSIGLMFMVLFLVACAMVEVKEIKVSYSPIGKPTKPQMKSPKTIKVEQFVDARVSASIAEFWLEGVGAKWVVKSDVVKVITDAIKVELANQGYRIVAENEDFILTGKLLTLVAEYRTVRLVEHINGNATIRVVLKDGKDNQVVWTDTVTGKSQAKQYLFPKWEEVTNSAIKDMIENLIKSGSLHKALK